MAEEEREAIDQFVSKIPSLAHILSDRVDHDVNCNCRLSSEISVNIYISFVPQKRKESMKGRDDEQQNEKPLPAPPSQSFRSFLDPRQSNTTVQVQVQGTATTVAQPGQQPLEHQQPEHSTSSSVYLVIPQPNSASSPIHSSSSSQQFQSPSDAALLKRNNTTPIKKSPLEPGVEIAYPKRRSEEGESAASAARHILDAYGEAEDQLTPLKSSYFSLSRANSANSLQIDPATEIVPLTVVDSIATPATATAPQNYLSGTLTRAPSVKV